MLFLFCVTRYIAWNHLVSGSLEAWNKVPEHTVLWVRHFEHCQYRRPSARKWECSRSPHSGQTKPSGQRDCSSACSHCASLP